MDDCDVNADCVNLLGTFECVCQAGFTGDGRKCESDSIEQMVADECAEDTNDCSPNADCTDLVDGFECQCRQGFSGDGRTCTGIYI